MGLLMKKSEIVYEGKEIIDGQMVIVRFERDVWENEEIKPWYIMLFIGDNMKQYKRWLKGKNHNENKAVNGNIGIKGLRFALNCLLTFQDSLKEEEVIIIDGTDAKRKRAYTFLLRYDGFSKVKFERKEVIVGFPKGEEEKVRRKLFNKKKRWVD